MLFAPHNSRSFLARLFALLLAMTLGVASTTQTLAQNKIAFVRDAEIEKLLKDYARPLLSAAGIKSKVEIVLVNDSAFNAFVDGRRIFINTGAIMQAETPNEIIGVLAHEIGHLAGHHQEKLRQKLEAASTIATIAAIAGIGAAVAGTATGNDGAGSAGAGIAAGSAEFARRSVLAYQRGEEITADRSAITYLNATGQSARGMLKTFKRFQSSLALAGTKVDPYQISHPLPRERIANLERLAKESEFFGAADEPDLQKRHDQARAKIAAYMGSDKTVKRLFRDKPDSDGAKYGDAISTYLRGSPKVALKKIDALIAKDPSNGYLQEMRGEVLLKMNKPKEAVIAYRKALKLDPSRNSTIQSALGQALLLSGDVKGAIVQLKEATRNDPASGLAHEYLARAYAQSGRTAEADLTLAELHFNNGNFFEAKVFATRAVRGLPKGTPAWIRANDIIKSGGKS